MLNYNCALQYAAKGWPVFPLVGKFPLKDSGGFYDASTDPEQIRTWFFGNDHYNVGIRTGVTSGLTVVDIDCHKRGGVSGLDTWRDLQREFGRVSTLSVQTPSGGHHLYFNYVEGSTNRIGFLPGLDVRSEGGYVVAPFSSLPEGKMYVWENNLPLFDVPPWLVPLITRPDVPGSGTGEELDYIPVGKRNETLFKVLCGLRYRGIPRRTAEKIGLILAEDCEVPLLDTEVKKTLDHVWQTYEIGKFKGR